MKTLAVYSLKGGVGKTAAAVNLAYLASVSGLATLLCDLDAQGSASFYFRIKPKSVSARRLVSGSRKISRAIKATDYERLDLLPASLSFRHLDIYLDKTKKHPKRLAKTLFKIGASYDLTILDMHAGLGEQAEAVFNAADLILLPVIPTTLSQNTLETVRHFFAKNQLNDTRLRFFLSMVDGRRRLHREAATVLEKDTAFLGIVIPYSSEVEKMGIERQPLCASHPHHSAAQAYSELWTAVWNILGFSAVVKTEST